MQRILLIGLFGCALNGQVFADVFNCTLPQQAPITLALALPTLTHQSGTQTSQAQGVLKGNILSYALPIGSYQLNTINLAYSHVPSGKAAIHGKCQRLPNKQPAASHCPSHRPYCKNIKTCNDAKRLLNQCGFDELDSDDDGTPCEALCGKGAK